MKQLIIFILQYVFDGLCSRIDTSFSNNLSLDAVCVLSSFTIITWVTYSCYALGNYAYRILLSRAKECLLASVAVSVVLGGLIFATSDFIPHAFSLTEAQYELFSKCLKVHAVSLPFMAAGGSIDNYLLLQCKNKILFVNNAIFWTIMVAADVWAVTNGKGLPGLIATTGFAYFVHTLTTLASSGIMKEEFHPSVHVFKEIFRHGMNICFDRLSGKVAVIVYGSYASKLGTAMYAIHAVCDDAMVFTEAYTNALYFFQSTRLVKHREASRRLRLCMGMVRRYSGFIVAISYTLLPIVLLITHGKVSYSDCFFYSLVYGLRVIPLIFLESFKAYLSVQRQSQYLRYGGVIGIAIRIPLVLVFYYAGLGIWTFPLAMNIDFTLRTVYFGMCSAKVHRQVSSGELSLED